MPSTQELPGEERIKIVDMQRDMISEAFTVAQEALSKHEIEQEISKHIKQHFDRKY
jgi:cation transport regulator ChaB